MSNSEERVVREAVERLIDMLVWIASIPKESKIKGSGSIRALAFACDLSHENLKEITGQKHPEVGVEILLEAAVALRMRRQKNERQRRRRRERIFKKMREEGS